MVTVIINQNSVISDRKNTGEAYRYVGVDPKDFYLGKKLERSEWIKIPTKHMSTIASADARTPTVHPQQPYTIRGKRIHVGTLCSREIR